MPKIARPRVEKTVNGKTVSQNEFKKIVTDIIAGHEDGAKAADVADCLGVGWESVEARQVLASTLINMANAGYLRRVAGDRGAYEVTARGEKGTDRFTQFENEICKTMAEHGGLMTRRDIEDEFSDEAFPRVRYAKSNVDRPEIGPGGKKRHRSVADGFSDELREQLIDDDQARRNALAGLRSTLQKSKRIRQNSGKRGLYNLCYDMLARVPQSGRNISTMIKGVGAQAYQIVRLRDPSRMDISENDILETIRPRIFEHVGGVVSDLRALYDFSLDDVVAHPPVAAALAKYKKKDPVRHRDRAKMLMAKDRLDTLPSDAYVFTSILLDYEEGDSFVHMAIDADFIIALADLYRCDAAFLALGVPLGVDIDGETETFEAAED